MIRLALALDVRFADEFGRDIGERAGLRRVVDQRREQPRKSTSAVAPNADATPAAIRFMLSSTSVHRLVAEGAHGAVDLGGLRDHVVGVAAP